MKKLFSLLLLCCAATMVQAQDKKTWDFTLGLSPETVVNLNADATNWTANGTDADGNTNNWKNATKQSGAEPWKANGEVIAELDGLLIDIGSNKDNSLHLAQNKLRLTRKGTKITFPQLTNGQTVTIVGRSANGEATNRGIAPVQDHLVLTSGTTTDGKCIFNGNKVEGSLGTYSFTWEVQTDEEGPVDVQFTLTPEGGIDFTLFMIDQGDVLQTAKVAYLYDGTEDVIYNYLSVREATELTPINITQAAVTADELQQYDVTVVSPSVPADNAVVNVLKEAMPWTPILNFNAQLYSAWGYGAPLEVTGFIKIKDVKNSLFKNVDYEEADEGNVIVYSSNGFETTMYGVSITDYFTADAMPGVSIDDAATLVHAHNVHHNGYIYLPYVDDPTEPAIQLIENAIVTLQGSKSEIAQAPAPVLSRQYKHLQTIVTMTPPALPGARIFYTTDGTDPTEQSQEYTGPVAITSPCTVRAAAIAEGYTLSKVTSLDVLVKEQPAAPVITYKESKGQTQIFFDCATPDAQIWYNFKNSTDTLTSSLYTPDSIDVVILMPQDVTAFATIGEPGEAVFSEITQQRVLVRKPRVVIDVASHFRAAKWDDVEKGAGIFPNGKSATSMYDTSAEPTEVVVDPETGDETYVYPEVEWMERDEPGDDPQWKVMSKGQAVLWQNNSISTDKVGINEGGYYPSVAEDIDPLFPATSYDLQFANIFAGEPANAAIMSKNKFQAPLDIVTFANMQGGPLVAQVSADGETWTTVGDEIAKTGYTRMWKKYTNSYNGTDQVYVRVAQISGGAGAKIFDIFVANEGENSKALLEQLHQEYGDWDDDEPNGDTNGDGTVDVADISAIITVMASGTNDPAADVNGDGSVDVADISSVITIMAGK